MTKKEQEFHARLLYLQRRLFALKEEVEGVIIAIETLGGVEPESEDEFPQDAFDCRVCGAHFQNFSDMYDHYDETHNHPVDE